MWSFLKNSSTAGSRTESLLPTDGPTNHTAAAPSVHHHPHDDDDDEQDDEPAAALAPPPTDAYTNRQGVAVMSSSEEYVNVVHDDDDDDGEALSIPKYQIFTPTLEQQQQQQPHEMSHSPAARLETSYGSMGWTSLHSIEEEDTERVRQDEADGGGADWSDAVWEMVDPDDDDDINDNYTEEEVSKVPTFDPQQQPHAQSHITTAPEPEEEIYSDKQQLGAATANVHSQGDYADKSSSEPLQSKWSDDDDSAQDESAHVQEEETYNPQQPTTAAAYEFTVEDASDSSCDSLPPNSHTQNFTAEMHEPESSTAHQPMKETLPPTPFYAIPDRSPPPPVATPPTAHLHSTPTQEYYVGDDSHHFSSSHLATTDTTTATAIVPLMDEATTATTTPSQDQLAIQRSNFVFLSEEQSVPTLMHKLQNSSVRRRDEFQSNVHELECRVAALTTALANERMGREKALCDFMQDEVYAPLNQVMEELSLQRDKDRASTTNWMQLEGRLSVIDSHMAHSIHVDLQDARINQLGRLRDELEQSVQTSFKFTRDKTDKREGGIYRRLEDMAGSMARRYQEERATRVAATGITSRQIKTLEALDRGTADPFLAKAARLQQQLSQEREERQVQDEFVLQQVHTKYAVVKEAILEAVGDPEVEHSDSTTDES